MATVEERLEQLEKEVRLLKLLHFNNIAMKPGWIAQIEGSFKDDPGFAEILRLGREERQALILNDE